MSIVIMGKTGYSCIRHLLCTVNLFFGLMGITILGLGVWLNISYETYARILPSYHVVSVDNLAIAAGALMLIIGFCGCCGSWVQNKCLLVSYLSLIVTIMLLEIAAGSLGYIFRVQIRETLRQELLAGIQHRYDANDTSNFMHSSWDYFQTNLNCCGVDKYNDWYNISAWPEQEWVPESCCAAGNATTLFDLNTFDNSSVCGRDAERDQWRYRPHGCYNKIRHWILEHLHLVGLTCIVFAFIQFFAIVAALLVVCTMDFRRNRPRVNSRPTYNRVPTL